MPLVNMKDMLVHAYENGYAVGAFDLTELDFLPAVLAAAESARAPVILSVAEPRPGGSAFDWVMAAVEAAAGQARVPVAIHLDCGADADSVMRGIRLGANGVGAAAVSESLFRHIDLTRVVVGTAHACGVPVEGDLGHVPDGGAGQDRAMREPHYTTVAEAKGFVERTRVDFFAVSAGAAHGRGNRKFDWGRLKEINAALKMPLVVRSGVGLTDEQWRRLIMLGVAKIHCSPVLHDVAGERLRANARRERHAHYGALKDGIDAAIAAQLEPRMRAWGSAGRAAEVLSRCRPWLGVTHIVAYSAPGLDAPALSALVSEGQRVLSGIPGVRAVQMGSVIDEGSRYRHCMLVRLVSAEAAESFRRHPAYLGFMERRLGPATSDRIVGDYHMADHAASAAVLPFPSPSVPRTPLA